MRAPLLPAPWSLRAERLALGLTQAQLALRLEIDSATVSRMERRGERSAMLQHALASVAETLRRESLRRVLALVRHGAEVTDSRRRRAAALSGIANKKQKESVP